MESTVVWDDESVPDSEFAPPLRLRRLRTNDERPVRAAQQAMAAEDFEFAFRLAGDTDWHGYMRESELLRAGIDVPTGSVPATFLLAVAGDRIVGRTSIRHELNDTLRAAGGHIGYCVLPPFRRRGYATEICRQSVVIARSLGVDPVLLTCDVDNTASRAVIERCGGELDPEWPRTGTDPCTLRYWIG